MTSAHVGVWTVYCCSGKYTILNAYVLWNYRPYASGIMTHFCASSVWVFVFTSCRWNYSLLLHWRNPRQSITCLCSGRSNEARPGKGVSHSSAAHCALPWCVFADWSKWFCRIKTHTNASQMCTGSFMILIDDTKEVTSFLFRMTLFCKTLIA